MSGARSTTATTSTWAGQRCSRGLYDAFDANGLVPALVDPAMATPQPGRRRRGRPSPLAPLVPGPEPAARDALSAHLRRSRQPAPTSALRSSSPSVFATAIGVGALVESLRPRRAGSCSRPGDRAPDVRRLQARRSVGRSSSSSRPSPPRALVPDAAALGAADGRQSARRGRVVALLAPFIYPLLRRRHAAREARTGPDSDFLCLREQIVPDWGRPPLRTDRYPDGGPRPPVT